MLVWRVLVICESVAIESLFASHGTDGADSNDATSQSSIVWPSKNKKRLEEHCKGVCKFRSNFIQDRVSLERKKKEGWYSAIVSKQYDEFPSYFAFSLPCMFNSSSMCSSDTDEGIDTRIDTAWYAILDRLVAKLNVEQERADLSKLSPLVESDELDLRLAKHAVDSFISSLSERLKSGKMKRLRWGWHSCSFDPGSFSRSKTHAWAKEHIFEEAGRQAEKRHPSLSNLNLYKETAEVSRHGRLPTNGGWSGA